MCCIQQRAQANVPATDFEKIRITLGEREIPPGYKIYFKRSGPAWIGKFRGKHVPGSHAQVKPHQFRTDQGAKAAMHCVAICVLRRLAWI